MDHKIRIDESVTRATPNERLQELKARNILTPENQQQLRDGDLNKIMDPYLYEATKNGDADKFVRALERVSKSRGLPLSLIFDQVTPSGNSLLHIAASSGSQHVMELILVHYPYLVTRKNSLEDTPLHVAVQNGRLEAIEMLIRLRRDSDVIYWKNKDSKSPLYLAAETACVDILRLLLEASARDEAYVVKMQGMSPVLAAFEKGKSGIVEEILDRLPKLLHVRGEDGGTPLHSAASVGNVRAVQVLLRKCPYLALQTDKNGSYPIHIACERGNTAILKLVNMWPNLAEIKNRKGQNILHVAAKGGNIRVLLGILDDCNETLFKKLANSKDADGNTPLHLASMHNHCLVLLFLTRSKISDFELLNNDKLTALDVAMESGSSSTKNPAFLGRAILTAAGVRRSQGRNAQSPTEQSSGASKSSNAEWIKDQVNTRLLVATVVATVTFTAGFTLPGGYNASGDPHPGMATMLHDRVFQLFALFNMLAMYSSILAVVVLLWGHISDIYVAELAHFSSGPLLLTALTSMTVAFLAAVIVAVSKVTWLALFALCIAVFYLVMLIMVLAPLVFPFSKTAMAIASLYNLSLALSDSTLVEFVNMYRVIFSKQVQSRISPTRNYPTGPKPLTEP